MVRSDGREIVGTRKQLSGTRKQLSGTRKRTSVVELIGDLADPESPIRIEELVEPAAFLCGEVSGEAITPPVSLDGSTFGALPWSSAASPPEPRGSCQG